MRADAGHSHALDSGVNTLQTFLAAHWQYQFTTSGGVECVRCAWANVCGDPGVARPPKNSEALVLGTYAAGIRMKTSGPKNVAERGVGKPLGAITWHNINAKESA